MRALLMTIAIASSAGCLRDTEFKCATDADCTGTGGTCESTKYCSFADTECADGRRYGAYSGTYSNQCVGGMMMGDAGTDTGGGGCPGTFMSLPNAGTHVYKPTSGVAEWATQRDRCMMDGGYLAIPDTDAELTAITTAAAAAKTWVGVNDLSTENAFVTVKGSTATYLPWDTTMGEPNNQGEQDCVAANMASPTFATERCSTSYPAICECDP
jgi:hypothetical protein